jgi:uncharacterized protein YbjT (DUF2867 family)
MKAFVAGATGETGRRIVKELVKRNIPVRAMVRNLGQSQRNSATGGGISRWRRVEARYSCGCYWR